jgi:phage terminase large subunit
MYLQTTATRKIASLKKRIRAVCGGTSASKTISILIWLIAYAQTVDNELISIVSESLPHLKRGAIRDFLLIMETQGYFDPIRWNKTNFTYSFESGSVIEFFSVDQPGKVRGPRRDVLFVNEANNISRETYDQLEVRTKKIIWLDWNPVSEFWWYTDVSQKTPHDFLTLTYKDNEALEKSIVQSIESRRENKNWWQVYGLGLLGEVENRIYTGWQIIDEVPFNAKLRRYGLDFGYSVDPTASDAIYEYDGGIIIDEAIHQKGLLNSQIADVFKNLPKAMIIPDSAEPKSIAELQSYGLMVMPAEKGKDSISNGIQTVQDQKISITKRSINTIKEYRNYLWLTDKEGRTIPEPSPFNNHHMDDIRYAICSMKKISWKQPTDVGGVKPYYPGIA